MFRLLPLLLALVLAAAACGTDSDAALDDGGDALSETVAEERTEEPEAVEEPTAAPGEGVAAVTSVFPLAWIATQIAPGADVTLLTSGGADPHDLELSPGDRALLESADVVLYMGDLDFQPQVERAVGDATGQVVSVRSVAGDDALLPFDHALHDEDDHGHDDEDDGDHEHGSYDPHLWFDTTAMAEVVTAIAEAFAAADADHTDAYRANAEALRDELLEVEAEIDALLSGCRLDTAIVSHEAYAYLLSPRGLAQEGISGAGGHGEASPQRIAELSELIAEQDIPGVLAEPLEGRDDAEAVARESGAELLEIDPLEIAVDDHLERGYLALLHEQAERFATALDCAGA